MGYSILWLVFLLIALSYGICSFICKDYKKELIRRDLSREQVLNKMVDEYVAKKEEYERKLQRLKSIDKQEALLDQKAAHINEQVRQRTCETVTDLAKRNFLAQTPVFRAIRNQPDHSRLLSALTPGMELLPPFDITSRIQSGNNCYTVTLHSCTCPDYERHRKPCKHMYHLATKVGALLSFDTTELSSRSFAMLRQEHSAEFATVTAQRQSAEAKKSVQRMTAARERILSEDSQSYPWLSKLYADFFDLEDKKIESELRTKRPPALKAADELKRIRKENRELRVQVKAAEYQLNFYESIFPWLEDFKELSPQDAHIAQTAIDPQEQDEYQLLCNWLSPEEYRALSTQEKYQLALDRYSSRTKTNWEVGIEYERYIGYRCEQKGCSVSYTGAKMGLEDMGRDLVVSHGNTRYIIQCKRWAQEKLIHEKHIFQLFGSCILYEAQNPGFHVHGVFVTTTELSPLAKDCASRLGIQLYEKIPFAHYPLIKCNISRSGENIYHLPFDQQYDRVVIAPEKGEFFASTVAEAEAAGFRRALRHTPAK